MSWLHRHARPSAVLLMVALTPLLLPVQLAAVSVDAAAAPGPPLPHDHQPDWREAATASLRVDPAVVVNQASGPPERVVVVRERGDRPVVEVRPARSRAAAVAEVARAQADPSVRAVEMDQPASLLNHPPAGTSEDPYRGQQWALDVLRAEAGRTLSGAESAVVAVLDTGVRGGHEDLKGAVLKGRSFLSGEDGSDGWNDGNGHGTHVAGTVAARTGNGIGVASLSEGAHVLPVRVLDDRGEGRVSDVAEGLQWAVDAGADIANLSLGTPYDSSVLRTVVAYAQSSGVLVVAAAGNERLEGDPTIYPAAHPGVLAVGATNSKDQAAAFSSTGRHLGVVAPGVHILSTAPAGYEAWSGTSMAAPHVSAAAAQLMATYPRMSADDVAALVRHTALDLGAPCRDEIYGAGRLRPWLALELGRYAQRLCASDRYGTAGAVALEQPVTQTVAYVANGTAFAGSMTASAAAGRDGAALLLVRPGGVPGPTAAALRRLRPDRIEIVGGPAAVSGEVLEELRGFATTGTVVRRWGKDRYRTAAELATTYPIRPEVAYVANGKAFPGAMTAGALAGRDDAPLLLVRPGGVPGSTRQALADLQPRRIVLVGGPAAVPDSVMDQLREYATSGTVERLWGQNRYDTAAEVARGYHSGVEILYVANGKNFPGAMTAGAPAGRDDAPLLLVKPDAVPDSTRDAIARLQPRRVVLVGGPAAVTERVRDALSRTMP